MKLDVPHYYQPKNSEYCGLASLRMVLEYYGHKFSYRELTEQIRIYKDGGTFLAELGLFAISLGLKAEEWHHQSRIVNKTLETSKNLLRDLKEYAKTYQGPNHEKLQIKKDIALLEKGGMLNLQIPQPSLIEDNLRQRIPVIAAVEGAPFYNDATVDWSHVVVIYGEEGNEFLVRDPWYEESRNLMRIPKQRFLFAWYQNHGFTLIIRS